MPEPTTIESTPTAPEGSGSLDRLVRRSYYEPTGYLIWDDGKKLMQEWRYEESTWYGYWHTVKKTEWREVPQKVAPNDKVERR